MNRSMHFCLAIAFAAIPGATANASPARAATSAETLLCHGGGTMKVELWHRGMTLHFAKAADAANTRAPAPGECAPADRRFSEDDPAMLTYTSTRLDDVTVQFGADGVVTGFDVHGSHGAPVVLRALLNGVRGHKPFRAQVRRLDCDGRPCPYFTVTGDGN